MQGKLAAGSWGKTGELEIRVARVFGIADLFLALGESFVAAELHYEYYKTCHRRAGHSAGSSRGGGREGSELGETSYLRWPLAARRDERRDRCEVPGL